MWVYMNAKQDCCYDFQLFVNVNVLAPLLSQFFCATLTDFLRFFGQFYAQSTVKVESCGDSFKRFPIYMYIFKDGVHFHQIFSIP